MVALESTAILQPGAYSSRRRTVARTASGNEGAAVGSPLPENVMTSGNTPAPLISRSFASRAASYSSALTQPSWVRRSALKPSSQYRQSNVQILPDAGMRLTPSDTPRRRLWIGPYTGPGCNFVGMAASSLRRKLPAW